MKLEWSDVVIHAAWVMLNPTPTTKQHLALNFFPTLCACVCARMEVGEQFAETDSQASMWTQGSSLGHHAWQWALLPAEASCWPNFLDSFQSYLWDSFLFFSKWFFILCTLVLWWNACLCERVVSPGVGNTGITVVSSHLCAGNWAQVLCRSCKCS